jgi:hypothetical protein
MSDEWEFYQSYYDDKPASFVVNLSYYNGAPRDDAGDVAWILLQLNQPREDGLSSSEEFESLCEVEDAILGALEECELINYYVGGCTSAGRRHYCIYSSNGQMVENLLGQAMVPYPNYEFETGHEHEPDWSTYLQFIYPTAREVQLISNRKVIEVLEEHNDCLEIPREVRHWIYFNSAEARTAFRARCEDLDFALDNAIDTEAENDQWGLILSRKDAVDYWSIADVTLSLFDLAIELGGKYDGWETHIVKDSGQEETS